MQVHAHPHLAQIVGEHFGDATEASRVVQVLGGLGEQVSYNFV